MSDFRYEKNVQLPKPMTGLEIKAALEKSTGEDFREEQSEHEGCLLIGAQPSRYPYGLAIYSDDNDAPLVENNTYQQIIVKNNNGWTGIVFAVNVFSEDVTEFCEKTIESFLSSLK